MSRWLFLPNSVQKDLDILGRLLPEKIDNLRSVLASDTGTRRYALILRIAEAVGIADEDAAGLYSLWRYVQDERLDQEKSGSDVVDELIALLRARSSVVSPGGQSESIAQTIAAITDKREKLNLLFGDFPERDRAAKTEKLGLGPLPHFVDIQALCDVRPIYDESASAIQGQTLVITIKLTSHSNQDVYTDSIINISEADLSLLEDELQRLRKKLAVLKSRFPELITQSRPHQHKKRR